jgi:hypothetical protein
MTTKKKDIYQASIILLGNIIKIHKFLVASVN